MLDLVTQVRVNGSWAQNSRGANLKGVVAAPKNDCVMVSRRVVQLLHMLIYPLQKWCITCHCEVILLGCYYLHEIPHLRRTTNLQISFVRLCRFWQLCWHAVFYIHASNVSSARSSKFRASASGSHKELHKGLNFVNSLGPVQYACKYKLTSSSSLMSTLVPSFNVSCIAVIGKALAGGNPPCRGMRPSMPLNFVASTRSPGMRRLRASLLHISEKSTSDDLLCNTELKNVKFK